MSAICWWGLPKGGAAQSIHFWVPADAAYATAKLAYMMLEGQEIKDGISLGVKGYENITIKKNAHGFPLFMVKLGLTSIKTT